MIEINLLDIKLLNHNDSKSYNIVLQNVRMYCIRLTNQFCLSPVIIAVIVVVICNIMRNTENIKNYVYTNNSKQLVKFQIYKKERCDT